MSLSVKITMPNFDGFLDKIQAAGNNVDEACKKAIDASTEFLADEMRAGAEPHKKGVGKYSEGHVYEAIEATPAVQEGNYIYGTVGINSKEYPEAVMPAIYEEYGDGHSKAFPDPFIRPAIAKKAEVRKIQKDILKSEGIPIE
jgi:hypothetical protein